jgi:hypothetical protein
MCYPWLSYGNLFDTHRRRWLVVGMHGWQELAIHPGRAQRLCAMKNGLTFNSNVEMVFIADVDFVFRLYFLSLLCP